MAAGATLLPEPDPEARMSASAAAQPAQTGTSVSTAAAAARQIVQAAQTDSRPESSGGVDIALDPPELGRVRLSLVEVNGVLSLSIAAERPETAELMRRHIALLSQEFVRAGLEAPSVDISQGGDDGRGEGQARTARTASVHDPMPDAAASTPIIHGPQSPSGGLDLRL